VEHFLQERGLELSQEKTHIRSINEGVDFLGFTIRRYRYGKVLTTPSKASQKRFRAEMKVEFKKLRTATQAQVIATLHPKITGWANYYKHCAAKRIFSKMDHWLWQKLWRWSCRRHPHVGRRKIKVKYFHYYQGNNWSFGYWDKQKGKKIFRHLPRMDKIPIVRHGLIKGDYNPYDEKWESYMAKRSPKVAKNTFKRNILTLWERQQGKCPHCKQEITRETKWHVHHIVPRSEGGLSSWDNLVLLHSVCHAQIHSRHVAGLPILGDLIYA